MVIHWFFYFCECQKMFKICLKPGEMALVVGHSLPACMCPMLAPSTAVCDPPRKKQFKKLKNEYTLVDH